ncbi:MAG: hypothetical protein ACI4MN_05990 [Candidatus Coproplasma sp.]
METLFDYPVMITEEEFKNNTGYDLAVELDGNNNARKVKNFLNQVHRIVYDDLIYSIGNKSIKKRMIEYYADDLKNEIKKALIAQGEYLLDNGDISLWNGAVVAANGTVAVSDSGLIAQKIVALSVINILRATEPNLLYMGE